MARGGPVKRTHTVSVRLTPAERERWDAARSATGRKELGAWVRDVVCDTLDASDRGAGQEGGDAAPAVLESRRPGGALVVPEVNRDAYRRLTGAVNNLNQLTRALNAGGQVAPARVAQVLEEVGAAARAVRGRPPRPEAAGGRQEPT